LYTLEAKTKQARENFATELRKVINRQKELLRTFERGLNGVQQQVRFCYFIANNMNITNTLVP